MYQSVSTVMTALTTVAAGVAAAGLIGCAPAPGSDVPNISDLCGTRTAATIPQAGAIRAASQAQATFDSASTALEKVIRSVPDVFPCPGDEPLTQEYVVGADGVIQTIDGATTENTWFVVSDGCLQISHDAPASSGKSRADINDSSASRQAAQQVRAAFLALHSDARDSGDTGATTGTRQAGATTNCAQDSFPVAQTLGDSFDPATDPYVCVRIVEGDSCQDCDDADGGWTFKTRTTLIFTAIGSLTDVQTHDVCTEEDDTVDLRLGEEVRVTIAIETRFEPVAQ